MNYLLLLFAGAAITVAALAVLRNRLVFELQATSILLFGIDKPGIILYSIFVLPGTIVHELSHWLTAEILRVPTGQITILPTINDDRGGSQNLGSVATGSTDPFRGLLIGGAPFVVGMGILVVLSKLTRDWWGIHPWWQLALLVYGMMVTGNSMLTSPADRRNWPIAIGFLMLLSVILWYLGLRPTTDLLNTLTSTSTLLLTVLLLTATLNLGTIGACLLIRKGVEQISHKRVIRN
ncbi:MAG: hypothetical protein WCL07_03920 [bacterium]